MEFERAIYRVYERCVEGLRDEDTEPADSKSCRFIEISVLFLATFFLASLIYLHVSFVGNQGCLPRLLAIKNITSMNDDIIIQVYIDRYLSVDDTSVHDLSIEKSLDDNVSRRTRSLLEMISDKPYSTLSSKSHHDHRHRRDSTHQKLHRTAPTASSLISFALKDFVAFDYTSSNNNTVVILNNSTISNVTNTSSSNSTNTTDGFAEPDYDYEFTFNVGEMLLPQKIRKQHNFEIINISMTSQECIGSVFARYLLPLGGTDTVVVNNFMSTFHKGGHLLSGAGDYYRWSDEETYPRRSVEEWLGSKILIVIASVFAFFVLSTATALLVRVLISSGVVLLLPVFALLKVNTFLLLTYIILIISIASLVLALRGACGHRPDHPPVVPLDRGAHGDAAVAQPVRHALSHSACHEGSHILPILRGLSGKNIMLTLDSMPYYRLNAYAAMQMTFSTWFYSQQEPGQRELWLFAVMMLWEYYGMIYVRSRNSIHLFPRATMALFLLYHFYLYSQPYGFHILALLVMFLYSLYIMIFCVRKYELQAFYRGAVNIDRPR